MNKNKLVAKLRVYLEIVRSYSTDVVSSWSDDEVINNYLRCPCCHFNYFDDRGDLLERLIETVDTFNEFIAYASENFPEIDEIGCYHGWEEFDDDLVNNFTSENREQDSNAIVKYISTRDEI